MEGDDDEIFVHSQEKSNAKQIVNKKRERNIDIGIINNDEGSYGSEGEKEEEIVLTNKKQKTAIDTGATSMTPKTSKPISIDQGI